MKLFNSGLTFENNSQQIILELDLFNAEVEKEMVGDWCPKDAFRLRLHETQKPKDFNKLSDDDLLSNGMDFFTSAVVQFFKFIRYMQPNIIIETGVQNGFTTELALGALNLNQNGKLYSIDCGTIGTDACIPRTWDGQPGKYVRKELQNRWDFRLGLSTTELPKILEELKAEGKTIDIFHHDSDHSTENIEFELSAVVPLMTKGGIICMHDRDGRNFKAVERYTRITIWNLDCWIIV